MFVLVSYDIVEDRRRSKIANTLKSNFQVLAGVIHDTPSDKFEDLNNLFHQIFECSKALNLFLKTLL